jgi:hypothetical protein
MPALPFYRLACRGERSKVKTSTLKMEWCDIQLRYTHREEEMLLRKSTSSDLNSVHILFSTASQGYKM